MSPDRRRLRPGLLIAALVGVTVLLSPGPAAAAAPECLRAETPPAPPAGGAVFARKLEPGTNPNVVVVPADSEWTASGSCGGAAAKEVMTHPGWIMVGSDGAVLLHDANANLFSAWGATDVRFGDPAPSLFPGRSAWTTTEARVVDQEYLLDVFSSCRSCSLARIRFTPDQTYRPEVAYNRDLSGADLSDATLTGGDFSRWNLSDSNLHDAMLTGTSLVGAVLDHTRFDGAHLEGVDLVGTVLDHTRLDDAHLEGADLRGAVLDHARVDNADFDGTRLQAARLVALSYQTPPHFIGVSIGSIEPEGACTSFKDTDLVNVKLTFSLVVAGCRNQPLLPGSQAALGLISKLLRDRETEFRVNFSHADFVATAADRAALAGADLHGINLSASRFIGFPAKLVKTNFSGANLARASFEFAHLSGANFEGADLAGASFRNADLSADGNVRGATFAGSETNLKRAVFSGADISGASFVGVDISGAVFSRVLAADTDFSGVLAQDAVFTGAHIYGNGQAFDSADDLRGADFNHAVLAGDVDVGGGFNFTHTDLTGATFDGAQCIACNFTGSTLDQAKFNGAYLPGAILAGVLSLRGAKLLDARLYCGDLSNGSCPEVAASKERWSWSLALGSGEDFGPVPFPDTVLRNAPLADVANCPDGKAGAVRPEGCDGHLLPEPAHAPPIPAACSAAGLSECPTPTSTILDTRLYHARALAPATPPTWASTLTRRGLYASFDDGTVRLLEPGGKEEVVAGDPGSHCSQSCGDGGSARKALLGDPSGLGVGLDGSLYIADPLNHRVRRIDPSGTITTVAGDGRRCAEAERDCGNHGPATHAALAGPYGVWVDPQGQIDIADGPHGIRRVLSDGTIVSVGAESYNVRSVVGDPAGNLYAATHDPDYIIKVAAKDGEVTKVVGTGTSGYNGNKTRLGTLAPGTSVQIKHPESLSLGFDGDVLFADEGNHLIRAYVPSSGHVIDLAGVVSNGAPQKGFNGDGRAADATELSSPVATAVIGPGLFAVADYGNNRVRRFGPSPND